MNRLVPAAAALACFLPSTLPAGDRTLSLEDRVCAQEAVERVSYAHQDGATLPFEEAVPRAVVERKVRDVLKKSLALERLWHAPITGEALRRETERMASSTRLPDRLDEIYTALGRDRFLFEETVARAALADRLSRRFFSADERIHAGSWNEARALARGIGRGEIDRAAEHPLRRLLPKDSLAAQTGVLEKEASPRALVSSSIESSKSNASVWDERFEAAKRSPVIEDGGDTIRVIASLPDAAAPAIAVYAVPKRSFEDWWREESRQLDESEVAPRSSPVAALPAPKRSGVRGAGAPCFPDDTWDNGSLDDMPGARSFSSSVWTGSEMIVWGGVNIYTHLDTGGRYDPATDTWRATSTVGAPLGRSDHTAVWTGTKMIVWGGNGDGVSTVLSSGGLYDPATDTWTPTSAVGAPQARAYHTGVWTGTTLVVWGGARGSGTVVNTGGRYDPTSDTWTATSVGAGVPSQRSHHTAIWTGTQMIVWGGLDGGSGYLSTGARYDPASDAWTAVTATGAPAARYLHVATWTGSRMIVWGGLGTGGSFLGTGSRYDPVANAWIPITATGVPSARYGHTAVWTGSRMIVWGGVDSHFALLASGGSYDPVGDVWSATATTGAASGRYRHGAVWAGSLMIVWGGTISGGSSNTGGRYDPASDSWTPTSTGAGPAGREMHTALWTGNRMIVWGGNAGTQQCMRSGGLYDPTLDDWSVVTLAGAPPPRYSHSVVWTGAEMIVWGGWGCSSSALGDGSRYEPIGDTWTPLATAGAPEARDQHSAVWTGERMIVWAGVNGSNTYLNTGGVYDPVLDAWTPTSQILTPVLRSNPSALWTGSRMLVWGGTSPFFPYHLNSGGLYDPVANSWTPTSTTNAPTIRSGHDTVWTGKEMIVWGGLTTGGVLVGDGARYDPEADTWLPISSSGAPAPRTAPSSVWTGREMLIWGGIVGGSIVDDGARYDAAADAWTPMTTLGAPPPRSSHTAVWTGSVMIPWGGFDTAKVNTGGRYAIDNAIDLDGDGLSSCDGDCNDADPGALEPPQEVSGLTMLDLATIGWDAQAPVAGPGTVYDVVRGSVDDLPVGSPGEICLASGLETESASDPSVPSPGSGTFYLVRARNSCGSGGYGLASSGAPRVSEVCP